MYVEAYIRRHAPRLCGLVGRRHDDRAAADAAARRLVAANIAVAVLLLLVAMYVRSGSS
jgi:hypothetical protein